MSVLPSFRIYCLAVIKMAKLLTREMSRAPVNNCFFPYQTVFFTNDNWQVYGVILNTYKSNIHNYGNKIFFRILHLEPYGNYIMRFLFKVISIL